MKRRGRGSETAKKGEGKVGSTGNAQGSKKKAKKEKKTLLSFGDEG